MAAFGPLRVLMVYPEPAPYIVAFVDALRSIFSGAIDVRFLGNALTQQWHCRLELPDARILPSGTRGGLGEVRRLLTGRRYQLLHLAGWGQSVLLGAMIIGAMRRIPLIVESDTPPPHAQSPWKRLIKKTVYPSLFRLPAQFLPGGTPQAEYLRHYGVEEGRIRIARMTVDVETISAYAKRLLPEQRRAALRRYGITEGSVRVLYLGRLEPHKGLLDLLEAFGRLKRQINHASLLIAGDGSLQRLVHEAAEREPSIHYLGRLSGDQVWEAYAISDIFVLPSRFEPWGLVVNEAMACGLPVIVTDRVGCIEDLVTNNETGLIVPAESPSGLFAAMKELVLDPALRQQMGRRAMRIIAGWTLANTASITLSAWREALE